jgi:hypothetical protein
VQEIRHVTWRPCLCVFMFVSLNDAVNSSDYTAPIVLYVSSEKLINGFQFHFVGFNICNNNDVFKLLYIT